MENKGEWKTNLKLHAVCHSILNLYSGQTPRWVIVDNDRFIYYCRSGAICLHEFDYSPHKWAWFFFLLSSRRSALCAIVIVFSEFCCRMSISRGKLETTGNRAKVDRPTNWWKKITIFVSFAVGGPRLRVNRLHFEQSVLKKYRWQIQRFRRISQATLMPCMLYVLFTVFTILWLWP